MLLFAFDKFESQNSHSTNLNFLPASSHH